MAAVSGFDPTTGTFTYTPNPNFNGIESIVFSVTDDNTAGGPALTSSRSTMALTVTPVNDPPVANPQAASVAEDTNLTINLTGTDGDPETNQGLSFTVVTPPGNGAIVSINAVTGTVVYRPASNFVGIDTFTFSVTDDLVAGSPFNLISIPATVTVTVTPVNDAPVSSDLGLNIVEDSPVSITLPATDGDPEVTQSMTFAIVSQPTRGTLSGFNAATGIVIYTPALGFNGMDSFTFQVVKDDASAGNPADLASNIATISIQVSPVNDPPVGNTQTVNTAEDNQVSITLSGDDGDPELNQTLSFAINSQPANGTLLGFNPTTGQVIYRPNANFNGTDTFTFTLRDNGTPSLVSAPATVTVSATPVNDPPIANATPFSINEDAPITFTLTGTDGDPERTQSLSFVLVTQPRGTISDFNPTTGELTYTPPTNGNGTDSFTFIVTDDATAGGAAHVQFTGSCFL